MSASTWDFGPPPDVPFEVELSDDDVAFFRDNGFLVVDRITTDEELAWLEAIYEYAFDESRPADLVRPVDRSGVRDPNLKQTITQVFHPEFRLPSILDTTYVRNARRIAAALLATEPDRLSVWTHMIRKAPGGAEVPPHQDEAFWPPELEYRSVAAWMPLHDVTVEMGAMQFVPGSNKGGVRHHRHYDDPLQHLLEIDPPVEQSAFVACPLRAGGCTFHDPSTIHQTGTNTTDRARLAFPLTVQMTPTVRPEPRPTPWLDEFLAAGGTRQTSYVADGKVLALPS